MNVDNKKELGRAALSMHAIAENVGRLAAPVCADEGLELVHVDFQREPAGRVLRCYIDKPIGKSGDKPGGVTLADCTAVSRQLGDLLDVAMPEIGPYHLEVSSPGIERPLSRMADFTRFAGQRAKIKTSRPVEGRKNFTGLLAGVEDHMVLLQTESGQVRIDHAVIRKARLASDLP